MGFGRRSLAWAAVAALVFTACTRSTDTTATTSESPTTTTTESLADGGGDDGAAPGDLVDPRLLEPIPVDPEVRQGTLDNGLRYFVRYNDSPGGRAELRLAVQAGSVLEDTDQLGGAHFLEHMMFNGTERFPSNELTAVLESFGPRFGPDINAYTNYDETVYSLGLPTDDEDLIELGIDVLVEWAARATIDAAEVEAEIGVVLDEWRLRDLGVDGRISNAFNELIVQGTPYEDRLPIGSAESIQGTTKEALERFYEDWYRPDLMAVVAVGDFDVEQIEDWIVERFGGLEGPADPPDRPTYPFEAPVEARAAALADPESPTAFTQVMWLTGSQRPETIGDLRQALLRELAVLMFATRFDEDVARGVAPFFDATGVDFGYVASFGVTGIAVDARPGDLAASVESIAREVQRVLRFGFSEGELDRALAEFETLAEQARLSQSTAQDQAFADDLVEYFLSGAPIPSANDRYSLFIELIEGIGLADVDNAFRRITDSSPLVLVVGPDGSDVPDEATLLESLEQGLTAEVTPRDAGSGELETLMARPDPAGLVAQDIDPRFGFATLRFENGVTVLLWQTNIADNSLVLRGQSFGGTSVIDVEDLPELFLITDIVSRSGVGVADQVQLERFLTDRFAGVSPYIDEITEGVVGGASTEDAETLLQLVHLYMTAPRADQAAVTAVIEERRPTAESPEDVPDLVVTQELIDAYYGDNPRYFAVPTPGQLDDFDRDRALQLYQERFADAADFTFAIVGDFEIAAMIDLAASYLGTLPSTGTQETFVDNQPLPPREVQVRTVVAGQDPQGSVLMAFTNPLESTARDRVVADLLNQILDARLRDRIREELSATYTPFANVDLQLEPDPFVESVIQVTGDPDRLAEISEAVLAELADLRSQGPTEQQLTTAQEQVRRSYELFSNPQLAEALLFVVFHPDEEITELTDRFDVVDTVSIEEVRTLAQTAFPANARIEIRLIPEG